MARLLGLFGARPGGARIDEEVAAHLEMLEAEFRERGIPPEERRLAARRAFGGETQMREEWRRRNGLPWLETLAQDAAYALRQLRHNPGFAAAAILTLALGIGANTAVYQVLYAVVLRPLPVSEPQQLVEIQVVQNGKPQHFSYPLFRELAAKQNALQACSPSANFPCATRLFAGMGCRNPSTEPWSRAITFACLA